MKEMWRNIYEEEEINEESPEIFYIVIKAAQSATSEIMKYLPEEKSIEKKKKKEIGEEKKSIEK